MAETFLPIRVFRQRSVDEQRVEGMGDKEKPKWVLTGTELAKHAEALTSSLLYGYDTDGHNPSLPYIYEVSLNQKDTSKTKRKVIVDMLNVEGANGKDNVIGMHGSTSLLLSVPSDDQIRTIAERFEEHDRYDLPLTCIESIRQFKPEVATQDDETIYKARLLDFGPDNGRYEHMFEEQLVHLGIAFERLSYAKNLTVYRLHADASQVQAVADGVACETLFFIRPMPRCVVTLDGMPASDGTEIMTPKPDTDYPIVGILDSGIEPIPQLSPWLTNRRMSTYTDGDLDKRHGTFVAGVATYGDRLEHREWVGGMPVRLLDAAILPADVRDVDEGVLADSIRTIIGAMHDRIKVWNLSISFESEVRDDEFSEFAIALDDIQDEYGVLICKSAGNCDVTASGHKGRIFAGADSVRALTVGSAAHKKDPLDMAQIGEASPFSRKGPGPQYIIKPEVSHYGGNAGVTPTGYVRSEVRSFDVSGDEAGAVGTSFSTPRVSALAANLGLAIDGEFDPLLIKALIVHSASFPGNSLVPNVEKVEEMGFGIPSSLRDILSDDISSATLVLRGTLPRGEKIEINDFPMPTSLIQDNGYYAGQIILTAAFSPLRAPNQGAEYCQSDIEVKFGTYDTEEPRDTTKPGILNPIGRTGNANLLSARYYSKPKLKSADDEFGRREKMLIKYRGKYAPMKKYALDLGDLTKKNREKVKAGRLWYMEMKGTYRDETERKATKSQEALSQEYCVIITIRDSKGVAPVYNEVPQLLDQHGFWHQNVELANQVRAMVGQ